jgi:hypothetical protein
MDGVSPQCITKGMSALTGMNSALYTVEIQVMIDTGMIECGVGRIESILK